MKKKYYIETQGCQMNEYDSDKMKNLLSKEMNFENTEIKEDADVLIVNTCSIREKAQEKVFSLLGKWRKLKQKNPNIVIGVAGCVASQESVEISSRAPYVDMVIGPQTIHRLPELYKKSLVSKKTVVDVEFPLIEKFDNLPTVTESKFSEFVTIMEGCSKYCSYCVVPYTRGTEVSRPLNDIIEEINNLVNNGTKEIILLGQNVNAYFYEDKNGNIINFGLLLFYIAKNLDIKRIRFTTSHPNNFDEQIYLAYEKLPQLVSHLHLPIQSGSDKILAAMKRGYTVLEYKSIIKRLKIIRPDITFSSDFIVGFPGETEGDFLKTIDIIKEIQFDQSYSFIYSKRPGTPAASIEDNISDEIKKERLCYLKETINSLSKNRSKTIIGEKIEILVEGISSKYNDMVVGRTKNNKIINIAGNSTLIGEILNIKVTELDNKTLKGEILNI
ncbi:MAG: tRNA (N6-isopentenyl adenosine(37)-C2)-methylthiotransferase MiaB [Gammaproteobacteria bacterium]|jgi:tRNA-2-methylthio-N6-dimethylallyladenosine synthase|nr:tRNA (N6-isopentenyl adenosine(37)-C2)-methylthiotransferase MiaB [Gammaproteobacteria bacterium]MBT7603544.1 tRNA (N6-isopentenyl adenosine(37)-C2)-methylthiotransferase MiaB [Gammaproteobacteria bacterium]